MIEAYFRAETARLEEACMAEIETLDDWKARRGVLREQMFEMLGLDPMPEKTPLWPVVTGTLDHDEFTVENLYFQSMPHLYVTANLYVPKGLTAAAPTILYVCGHGPQKIGGVSYGNKASYQHHGAWFARNGYVCLVIDTVQMGEIEGIHHGTYRYGMWWWNSRGYTSAGAEAWNCIRALDYLETRKEVDKDRIGVTGRSGGGAYSWWIGALDERIKAAVPVAGITDLQNHVVDGCVEGHCDCMYMVNTYGWDYPLVAALMAPRPLLIANSDKDSIFPLEGVVRLHEKVRHVYRLYGAGDKLGLYITEGPHTDTQQLQVGAFGWFNRWLKNDMAQIEKTAEKLFDVRQLKVFETLPKEQINTRIQESFTPQWLLPAVPESLEVWRGLSRSWMKALREKCFRGWPAPDSGQAPAAERVCVAEHEGISLAAYDFNSQENVGLRVYLAHRTGLRKPKRVVLRIADQADWDEFVGAFRVGFPEQFSGFDTIGTDVVSWKATRERLAKSDEAVAFFAPRGIGLTAWASGDERKQTHIRRRFMLLGQTLDGMRLWDVRQAVRVIGDLADNRDAAIEVEGQGVMAGLAVYAVLFEPAITGCRLWNPPATHGEGPIFLNALRFLDMPAAMAMAAEKCRLTIWDKHPERWAWPQQVAQKCGWAEHLEVCCVAAPGIGTE
ncbi:MAG: prolyl oligopeptidase family serine peptidase [Phycisphaerae bacterium]|nr:prolyl oligopeptidase family serine peptidase [Phycisphaerae bacterium]